MGAVFFGVLRSGTVDEARAFLTGIEPEGTAVVIQPTEPMPPQPSGVPESGLSGDVTMGAVTVNWRAGVPVYAEFYGQPETRVDVPYAWWAVLTATAPQEVWQPFTYIAFLESRYYPSAHNGVYPDDSYGALQINRLGWPQFSPEYLTTYAGNITAAMQVYDAQGFGAWYNSSKLLGLVG